MTVSLFEWAHKHNIILFLLPAHTSHLLQPLEFGNFETTKVASHNECQVFFQKNHARVMELQIICRSTAKAICDTMILANIVAGFRYTGIFPVTASLVTDEQMALNGCERKKQITELNTSRWDLPRCCFGWLPVICSSLNQSCNRHAAVSFCVIYYCDDVDFVLH